MVVENNIDKHKKLDDVSLVTKLKRGSDNFWVSDVANQSSVDDGKVDGVVISRKLSEALVFFSDNRVCSYDCSYELALSYLEIFEDDMDSAVMKFLESDSPQKQQQPSQPVELKKSATIFAQRTNNDSFFIEKEVNDGRQNKASQSPAEEEQEKQAEEQKLLGNAAMAANEFDSAE